MYNINAGIKNPKIREAREKLENDLFLLVGRSGLSMAHVIDVLSRKVADYTRLIAEQDATPLAEKDEG